MNMLGRNKELKKITQVPIFKEDLVELKHIQLDSGTKNLAQTLHEIIDEKSYRLDNRVSEEVLWKLGLYKACMGFETLNELCEYVFDLVRKSKPDLARYEWLLDKDKKNELSCDEQQEMFELGHKFL